MQGDIDSMEDSAVKTKEPMIEREPTDGQGLVTQGTQISPNSEKIKIFDERIV